MISIPRLTPFTYVLCEIEPFNELGLPADPTIFRVSVGVSQERHLTTLPTMRLVQWFTNNVPDPPKYYAGLPYGSETDLGVLDVGVWYPFSKVETNPEIPLLAGEPFRIA